MSDLFSKLQEARHKIEEAKKRLNQIVVEAEALKIVLEKTLTNTINKALDEAAQRGESEMKEITKGMLPNFPGLI